MSSHRQLTWLGHVTRLPSHRLLRKVYSTGNSLVNGAKEGRTTVSKNISRPPWRNATFHSHNWKPLLQTRIPGRRESTCKNGLTTFLAVTDQAAKDRHTRRYAIPPNLLLADPAVLPASESVNKKLIKINPKVIWKEPLRHPSWQRITVLDCWDHRTDKPV